MSKLTDKQEAFCREYIVDLNATQAAIRAKYSERTAQQVGSENLSKPLIQGRIAELMQKRTERTQIDADWVLKAQKEVYEVAMGIKPTKTLVRESVGDGITQHLVQEFEKHDLAAANKALDTIGKHVDVQAWRDKVDLSSSDGSMSPKGLDASKLSTEALKEIVNATEQD